MTYLVYYTCPNCKSARCGSDPMEKANEIIEATSKAEAVKIFNQLKPCRKMKAYEVNPA